MALRVDERVKKRWLHPYQRLRKGQGQTDKSADYAADVTDTQRVNYEWDSAKDFLISAHVMDKKPYIHTYVHMFY